MYVENLYDEILIKPITGNQKLNKLLIVSGYATAAMAFRYLNYLKEQDKNISVKLIVGMTVKDGLTLSNHNGLKR